MRPDARIALMAHSLHRLGIRATRSAPIRWARRMRQLGATGDVAETTRRRRGQRRRRRGADDLRAGHQAVLPPATSRYGSWDDENPDRWIWEFRARSLSTPSTSSPATATRIYHLNPTGHTEWANCLHRYGGSFGASGALGAEAYRRRVRRRHDRIDVRRHRRRQVRLRRSFVQLLQQSTSSYRFALVTYRDWPQWTGDPE